MTAEAAVYNRNIKLIIIQALLSNLLFFIPIMTLFLLERGLNYLYIFLFGALSSFSTAALELPSGIFADKRGRKNALILANLLLLLFTILLYLADNIYVFLLVALLWGAASAMQSGAGEAIVYESLQLAGREGEAEKVFGKIYAAELVAALIAPPVGSLVASISGYAAPVILSSPLMAASLVVVLALKEPEIKQRATQPVSYRLLIRDAREVIFDSRLRLIILNQAVVAVVVRMIYHLNQPHFLLSGIDVAYFGLIFAAATAASAVFAMSSKRVEQVLGVGWTIAITAFIPALAYITLSLTTISWLSATGFITIVAFRQLREPLLTAYRNRLMKSESRATMISAAELITALIGLGLKPLIGVLADQSLMLALAVCGGILVAAPLVFRVTSATLARKVEELVTVTCGSCGGQTFLGKYCMNCGFPISGVSPTIRIEKDTSSKMIARERREMGNIYVWWSRLIDTLLEKRCSPQVFLSIYNDYRIRMGLMYQERLNQIRRIEERIAELLDKIDRISQEESEEAFSEEKYRESMTRIDEEVKELRNALDTLQNPLNLSLDEIREFQRNLEEKLVRLDKTSPVELGIDAAMIETIKRDILSVLEIIQRIEEHRLKKERNKEDNY